MSENITSFYADNGYVIIKDVIKKKRLDSLLENIFKLYCKYSDNLGEFEVKDRPWETEMFHEKLIELRKTKPDAKINAVSIKFAIVSLEFSQEKNQTEETNKKIIVFKLSISSPYLC